MEQNTSEIIKSICTQYNWPYQIEEEAIIFEVTLTNNRTQACSASVVKTRFGESVHVQSPIGKFDELNIENIAKHILEIQ